MQRTHAPASSSTLHTPRGNPGQVAVIVLLIMAGLLIIVLNYASRTTDQVFLSGQQQDTTRVFNAAESGVEEALSQFGSGTVPLTTDLPDIDGVSATRTVTPQSGLELANLPEGMAASVALSGVAGETMTVLWAEDTQTCNEQASIAISIYYDDGGIIKSQVIPVKPACGGNGDGFVVADNGGFGLANKYEVIPLPTNAKIARITALYNSTKLKVSGVTSLQAHDVEVRANANQGSTSNEERAIKVTRTLPAPPMVLDYAVYSGGTLTK